MNETANRVLDVAEQLTQTRGFNAFSYKDLQQEVGVKTSSIHYYFPTKQDLALEMTKRYKERYQDALHSIARENDNGVGRLAALGRVFVNVVNGDKFCLCGMLASDCLSMPTSVNNQLKSFFELNESWIADAIALGQQQGEIKPELSSKRAATIFIAMLEGAMLIARSQKNPAYLEEVVKEALSNFAV